MWTKHSHMLWGLCDNCIIRFLWNGFGGLSPWWVGICKRTLKPACVICLGCQSALSVVAPGESWHCPAACLISNKLVLLHVAFYEPQDNMEMPVDWFYSILPAFPELKRMPSSTSATALGGELFVWWKIPWVGVQKTEIFSHFCTYELVSWTHRILLVSVLLEHICVCSRNWELPPILPSFLGITTLKTVLPVPFSPEQPVRYKQKLSGGALRVDKTTISHISPFVVFPAWNHNLMVGAPSSHLGWWSKLDDGNHALKTEEKKASLHPWWHWKPAFQPWTAYFCTSYYTKEKFNSLNLVEGCVIWVFYYMQLKTVPNGKQFSILFYHICFLQTAGNTAASNSRENRQ